MKNRPCFVFSRSVRKCLLSVLLTCFSVEGFAECNANIPANNSPDSYTVNADNSITDKRTGLTWMRCPVGYEWLVNQNQCVERAGGISTFTWQEALAYADAAVDESGNHWRLPNTKELESLLKRNCHDPAIETSIFSDLALANHWTSTAAYGYYGNAWAVNFRDGSHITADKQNAYSIRLVRSH